MSEEDTKSRSSTFIVLNVDKKLYISTNASEFGKFTTLVSQQLSAEQVHEEVGYAM